MTANTCFGTKAEVQHHVGQFFRNIANRTEDVKRRTMSRWSKRWSESSWEDLQPRYTFRVRACSSVVRAGSS